jgi:hypothetical protein
VAVIALVLAAGAVLGAPPVIGYPIAAFIVGLAAGGFWIHVRMTKRVLRVRTEMDDLLRQNGALRHRNNVLASGVITRESQATQALLMIPEDDGPLKIDADPQRTQQLPELPDDVPDDPGDTADLDDADPK